ncbi:amidohydrolase family protein [Rhodohalobacter sp. 614A]|uniref:amidohydrolase family protein n=1 Tax=Rhodohalobacter sp. 614A TaxID=2908649 RepID=UPI001F3533BB|nr:amidohydrolase family protein [Rhodohalobacter sp. 614A]
MVLTIKRINKKHFRLLIICLFLIGCNEEYQMQTVLINGNIIDGTGTELKQDWDILISDDKITKIGPNLAIPQHATTVDVSGLTILPGLIDMHGHIYANLGSTNGISNQKSYLKFYLAGGVTTIYSPGEYDAEGTLDLQNRVSQGQEVGPNILTTGPYFDHSPSQVPWINGIKSVEELEYQFNKWSGKIDGVKVYTSITSKELSRLVELADSHDLPVTGHLGSVTANEAIDLGIHGLEHGIFGMPEFFSSGFTPSSIACQSGDFALTHPEIKMLIDKIIDNQVYLTPTIITFQAMLVNSEPVTTDWQKYLSSDVLKSISKFEKRLMSNQNMQDCLENGLKKQSKLLKEIYDRGGLIVAGTDPVGPMIIPGFGLHREMQLLVEAGLPPMAAIQAATINAAKALRKDAEFGSIETGKLADLIVVEGDPSQNINHIGNTVMVFKNGKQFNPSELRESVIGKIGGVED